MNIYNIEKKYRDLGDMLNESDGVITEEIENYMEKIQLMTVANLYSLQDLREEAAIFVAACKEKAAEFTKKAKKHEAMANNLKTLQIQIMELANQDSVQNGVYKMTLTKNPLKIEVEEEDLLPRSCLNVSLSMPAEDYDSIKDMIPVKSVTLVPDKKKIAAMYKENDIELPGVSYVRDPNIRVT